MVGNETRVKVVKNKVSPPFRQAESRSYEKGIYRMGEVIDWGVKEGLVIRPALGTATTVIDWEGKVVPT